MSDDSDGRPEWRVVGETLGLTDPDAPPPVRCLVLSFVETWLAPYGSDDAVSAVGIGIDAPDQVVAALRAEPALPNRVETQWSVEAYGAGHGAVVCCRVTAAGENVHRMDLIIPGTDSLVAMFTGASSLIVAADEELRSDEAALVLRHPLLLVPNEPEFWRGLADVDLGDPLTFE